VGRTILYILFCKIVVAPRFTYEYHYVGSQLVRTGTTKKVVLISCRWVIRENPWHNSRQEISICIIMAICRRIPATNANIVSWAWEVNTPCKSISAKDHCWTHVQEDDDVFRVVPWFVIIFLEPHKCTSEGMYWFAIRLGKNSTIIFSIRGATHRWWWGTEADCQIICFREGSLFTRSIEILIALSNTTPPGCHLDGSD